MATREELVAGYLAGVADSKKKSVTELVQPGLRGGLESPTARTAVREVSAGVAAIDEGRLPTPEQVAGIEAIILPKIRPVLDIVDGSFRTDHPLWLKLNDDMELRGRLMAAIPSIGRVELPGNPEYPYGGTAFVVGRDLIMTNRHVAAIFATGVGTLSLAFRPGLRAGIDFRRELDRPTGPTLMVRRVVMIHPYWDMALLEVEGLAGTAPPLSLALRDVTAAAMIEVAAVGYPAFDPRNPTDVQNDLFRTIFGVKRLQPGTLGGRTNAESFGKLVPAMRHNCSTLGGNSGSALLDLATGHVVALHFGGRYLDTNYGVPACELANDSRIVDAGVTFAGTPAGGDPSWSSWWRRADQPSVSGPDRLPARDSQARDTTASSPAKAEPMADGSVQLKAELASDGSMRMVVPLVVTLRLGMPGRATEAAVPEIDADAGAGVERLAMPFHDEDYSTRTGYDPMFLGAEVPMPHALDRSVIAESKDGSDILPYQNFSIIMHRQRRLAMLTASNVTAEPNLKRPEPGRNYSRKALAGLGANDREQWFPDPRLDAALQLPDVFYTKDNQAFDKGHVVRRDDVAWGTTYDLLRRANGDTYHVTNCSPQVAGFNRSTQGEDNWGDLEDHVLKGAASERYCVFAGPILDPADEVFVGVGDGRTQIRAKIPSRFWKVIVARTADRIVSYGFLLEQDLSNVPLEEFMVRTNFRRYMEPISDLGQRAGIAFPEAMLEADRYGTDEGVELAFSAGIQRHSLAEGVIVDVKTA